jgi:hypothetical protein
VFVVACGQSSVPGFTSGPGQKPATPAPVEVTVPPAPLSAWQQEGATAVPPQATQVVSLDGIQVVNQTGGAVNDTTATTWAMATLRGINFEFWAVSEQQDQFLRHSNLSSAPLTVFLPDLTDITTARRSGSRVEYTRKVFRRMVLRPVPASMQTLFAQHLDTWKPYAFYLDAIGPSTKRVTDSAGHVTTQTLFQPGQPAYELVGGEIVHDPLMGDVFSFGSDWNCLDSSDRQKLAPLCNP